MKLSRNGTMMILAASIALVIGAAVFCLSKSGKDGGDANPGNQKPGYGVREKPGAPEVTSETRRLLIEASSPEDLRNFLSKNPKITLRHLEAGNLLHKAALEWFAKDPQVALEMIEVMPDNADRYSAFLTGRSLYASSPDAFLSASSRLLSPENAASVRRDVFKDLASSDPRKGIDLIEAQGQGENKKRSVGSYFSELSRISSIEAVDYVDSLAFPEDREVAYKAISEAAARGEDHGIELLQANVLPASEVEKLKSLILSEALSKGEDAVSDLYKKEPSLQTAGREVVAQLGRKDISKLVDEIPALMTKGLVDLDRDAEVIGMGIGAAPSPNVPLLLGKVPADHREDVAAGIAKEFLEHPSQLSSQIKTLESVDPHERKIIASILLNSKQKREGVDVEKLRKMSEL